MSFTMGGMTTARKLPPAPAVAELVVVRGLTHAQVASMFGVTRQAVTDCLHAAGVASPRGVRPYRDFIPWHPIAAIHNNDLLLRRLRLYARQQMGAPLRPGQAALLDQFLAYMRENNAVVIYDPNKTPGFRLAPRLPTDTDLVRP